MLRCALLCQIIILIKYSFNEMYLKRTYQQFDIELEWPINIILTC